MFWMGILSVIAHISGNFCILQYVQYNYKAVTMWFCVQDSVVKH